MVGKLLLLILLLERDSTRSSSSLSHPNGVVVASEKAYLNWVKQMGFFKHSMFQKATNMFTPCKTIKVNVNSRFGDFVTVQKAIDSLPLVNHCRVVISVSAGIYR
jgi:pectinesterase